jgi:crotonobetainyl-CoA:carnitine CoA-transferase CaiB-like acyl-CoA transferase
MLSGVRILDLSRMLAGPYGALLMGDLGAEVIKIEMPEGGDPVRQGTHITIGGENAFFLAVNRSKKSLTLDLTREEGREVFYKLVKVSDVVYDNFRPEALKKLGCGYETLKEHNPRIISCSISGYGQDGPHMDQPSFDLAVQARSGGMSITGEPGRPPVRAGIPIGDLAGGMFGAYAIAAALYRREQTGEGQKIDISLLDCQISMLTYVGQYYFANGVVPGPIGTTHQSAFPYQSFRARDGYLVIAAPTEKFWRRLCKVIGREDLAENPKYADNNSRVENRDELEAILEKEFAKEDVGYWMDAVSREGIPAAPVNTVDKALADEQVLARGMVFEMDHPGVGKYKALGNPVKASGCDDGPYEPAPALGAHTDEILREYLGYTGEKIQTLRQNGII